MHRVPSQNFMRTDPLLSHYTLKLYRKQLAKVKVAGTLSEWFRVKKGVRQGCVLSPYLFNILAEIVMRETLDGFQSRLQGRIVTNLRYADDIRNGHFRCRTTGAGGSPIELDWVRRKYSLLIHADKTNHQCNGERRHSVPHSHSEWATGEGGYVLVPWVPDYRR